MLALGVEPGVFFAVYRVFGGVRAGIFSEVVEVLASSLVAMFPYGPAVLRSKQRRATIMPGESFVRFVAAVVVLTFERAAAADVVENGLSSGEWFVHGE